MKSIKTPNSQNTGPKNNSLGTMKTLQPKLAKDDVSLQEEIHEVNAKPVIEQSTYSQNFTPLKSFTTSRQPQLTGTRFSNTSTTFSYSRKNSKTRGKGKTTILKSSSKL